MLTVPNGSLIHVDHRAFYDSAAYIVMPATTTFKRGRVYFFLGLQQGPAIDALQPLEDGQVSFFFTYNGTMAQLLNADGWEVVLLPDPADFIDPGPVVSNQWNNALVNPDMRDDPNHGSRYVQTILKSFDTSIARVNADRGWLPSLCGGASWGAFTSAQIAVNRAILGDGTPLIGFFGSVCPVVLGNVVNIAGPPPIFPFITSGADLGTLSGDPITGTWTSTFLNGVRVPAHFAFGSQDTWAYRGGCSVMVQSALAAGAPFASRTCDATISGTAFSSVCFCWSGNSNEDGAVITGPGVPGGTTLGSIVDTSGNGAGPWTGTLSQPCTSYTPLAVTAVTRTGTQVTYTTAAPHGLSPGASITTYGFTSSGSITENGTTELPSPFNLNGYVIQSVTTNTITVNSNAAGTVTGFGFLGQSYAFPGLAPAYNNIHTVDYQETIDIVNWVTAVLDPDYPMVL